MFEWFESMVTLSEAILGAFGLSLVSVKKIDIEWLLAAYSVLLWAK
jgi:hypothetical protein